MAALRLSIAALALAAASACDAESVTSWHAYVAEASLRFGVPTNWIEQVMRAESNGKAMLNGRQIRSRVGAIGLMQLMPKTWKMLRYSLALGFNPDDPHDNILAGTLYLRMMYERFGYPGMFAAYDAGPARFAAHLTTGRALPDETIAYLSRVTATPSSAATRTLERTVDTLFAAPYQPQIEHLSGASGRSAGALFAVRSGDP